MRKINFAWIMPVVLIVFSNVVQADDISDLKDAVKKLQLEVAELKQQNTALKGQIADMSRSTQSGLADSDKRLDSLESVIQVGSTVTIESASTLLLKGAIINIQGNLLKLNGGSKPAAFVGSDVAGNKVINGSTTVLVP